MIIVRAAALLVALHCCIAWSSTEQRRPGRAHAGEPFTLGVLRADGVVIPFATWDGESWSVDWPQPVRDVELPINFESIPPKWWGVAPPARTMSLWSDGVRLGEIEIERPAMVGVMCTRRIGLRSNHRANLAVPPPFEPLPKQGLVVSGSQPIESLPRVSNYSPDVKSIGPAIAAAAAEAETGAERHFTNWSFPFDKAARLTVPVEVETVYRVPMDEPEWGSATYVEAVKRYPVRPWEQGCGLVSSISGWIRRPPKGAVKYDLSARISYCDRAGATYLLPLGVVRVGGRTFWVFQTSGWSGEWYSVVRPSSKGIEYHADYEAGRCSQR